MFYKVKLLSTLLLLSVLAACAPAAKGGSLQSALNLGDQTAFDVTAGNTWYFSRTYPASYFDLELGDIPDKAFGSGSVGSVYRQPATKHFKLETTGLPESWTVKLQSAQGTQILTDVTKTSRRTSLKWLETVTLYFAVTIPQDTTPNRYTGLMTVTSDKNEVGVLPLTLKVGALSAGN